MSSSYVVGATRITLGFKPKYEHYYRQETYKSLALPRKDPKFEQSLNPETSYKQATLHEKRCIQHRINTENARKELCLAEGIPPSRFAAEGRVITQL